MVDYGIFVKKKKKKRVKILLMKRSGNIHKLLHYLRVKHDIYLCIEQMNFLTFLLLLLLLRNLYSYLYLEDL